MFQKGSTPNWSSTIHKIENRTEHMYTLDNGKGYKYYELQKVITPEIYKKETRQKEPEREELRKKNTIKRRLKKEGIQLSRIIKEKRIRKPMDRLMI